MAAKKNQRMETKRKEEIKMEHRLYEKAVKDTYGKVMIKELINFDKPAENPIKVSIVIPVYNVENYLHECMNSAINQSLKDIEIICVNDGSTDNSLRILKEYAAMDSRVKIIDKNNAGYGHTMNIGMDMAQGEYIGIIESDDYVKLIMFETLYNIAAAQNIDIVKADFYRFTVSNGYLRLFYNVLSDNPELYNKAIYDIDSLEMFKFTNTWSGIYKRSFLRQYIIRHNETPGASYQDNGFWFQTTISASSIYYLDRPFYMNRRDNPNSSVYQRDKVYIGNKEYDFIYQFLERNPILKDKYIKYFSVKKFDYYYYTYRRISSEFKKEYVLTFSKEFKEALAKDEIDETLFCTSNYSKLCKIINNPVEFYEETNEQEHICFETKVDEENTIPIVFICDNGYTIPTATAVSSLLKFKKKATSYDITFIAVDMTDENIRKLALIKAHNITINIVSIEQNIFNNLHAEKITNYGVSTTALIKFLLPDIMEHCNKILYLDGDIIIKRDLTTLYKVELEDSYAGVVRDIPQVLYKKQIFGVKYGSDYFNSGVMLLNTKKMRDENIPALLAETKKNINSHLMDQDVFNEVFYNNVRQLSIIYNTLYVNLIRSKGKYAIQTINKYYGTNYKKLEDIRRSSSIIHYCSKDKPWKYYDVPMADVWLEHYFRSSVGDMPLIRRSISEAEAEVFCNGDITLLNSAEIQNTRYPLVFHYNACNTKEIIDNIQFVDTHIKKGEQYEIYILYENEYIPEYLFDEIINSNINIHYIDISKMIIRDKEYSCNGKLPDNYYRILVPEILSQFNNILIIDGTILTYDIRRYFQDYTTNAIFSLINKECFSFWNTPAIIINVKKFICNITKFKFFDAYNRDCHNYYTYSKSISEAVPEELTGSIDAYFFDASLIEQKEQSKNNSTHNNGELNTTLTEQHKIIEQLRYELLATRTSFSCRLGLFLTAIPRKIFNKFRQSDKQITY